MADQPHEILRVEIRTDEDGNPTLLWHGRIIIETSELFKSEIKKLVGQHHRINIDLSDVRFVDSSGLGTILASYISTKSSGCDLRLINPSQPLMKLLKMTHLSSVFDSYEVV